MDLLGGMLATIAPGAHLGPHGCLESWGMDGCGAGGGIVGPRFDFVFSVRRKDER
jgi:hypothetical protein